MALTAEKDVVYQKVVVQRAAIEHLTPQYRGSPHDVVSDSCLSQVQYLWDDLRKKF